MCFQLCDLAKPNEYDSFFLFSNINLKNYITSLENKVQVSLGNYMPIICVMEVLPLRVNESTGAYYIFF